LKKSICLLSLAATTFLLANEVEVPTVNVQEKVNTKVVKSVSENEIKSADLAEALTQNIPSISLVRRSGIANDIILRGQKKDNINILIDDAKIYGACPNRMDPTTSHILSNNVESVEVIEGPYDVENFGTLSGKVKVNTIEPTKELKGEINLNAGSFNYRKASATVSGGTDRFKLLVSASTESSDQYEDGNGNDFYGQQVENGTVANTTNEYSLANRDHKAYTKKTLLSKAIFNIDDSSEVKLSYTANRSDNVLYPNTPMDADYDDSNIYTFGYTKRNLGKYSKELNLDYYYSNVDHPMSTTLRDNGAMQMTNHMKSSIWGTKIKNSMDVANDLLTFGLDTSIRNWKGKYYNKTNPYIRDSIASTDTQNKAMFINYEKSIGNLDIKLGGRYDNTSIDNIDATKKDNDYDALNANIFTVYNLDNKTKIFAGIGKSERVPDARELYFVNSAGTVIGNPDLKAVKNYEADFGFEKTIGNFNIKSKLFYSILKDYIYTTNGTGFMNIDAKIYGADVSGFYYMSDALSLDYGMAYQRGQKDEPLTGQTDKDLGEIPPLKANLALNYEYLSSKVTAEMIALDNWSNIDSDNGEQELGGYAIFNLKYKNKINKSFEVTLGVDNVFDKTYASTNTYKDISYVTTGGSQTLLNDPGRYAYINLRYMF